MKYLPIAVLTALILVPTANGDDAGKHLFILSGQSNMVGMDPGVSFTPAVTKAFGKDQMLVVKDAHSGQSIRSWAKTNHENPPPTRGRVPKVRGNLYPSLINKVHAAIKGEQIQTVTFVWMQGESDLNNTAYDAYLDQLYQQLQADLDFKDIDFVIGRISDSGLDNPKRLEGRKYIRRTQAEYAESHPRGAWVDTDDLNDRKVEDKVINDLHYTSEGYRTLGKRFAEKAIALIEGKGTASKGSAASKGSFDLGRKFVFGQLEHEVIGEFPLAIFRRPYANVAIIFLQTASVASIFRIRIHEARSLGVSIAN